MRILALSNFYPPHHIGGYELRCREVVEGLRRRGHEVCVLTGRYGAGYDGERSADVVRALQLAWGPPYPPEDLVGLLATEAADRRALADLVGAFQPDVVAIWGMEFASQSLVASVLASALPVHLCLDDRWLLDAWSRDALCQVAGVADRLGVEMSAGVRGLCCLSGRRPAVGNAPISFVSTPLAEAYAKAGVGGANARLRLAGIDVTLLRDVCPAPPPPPFVIVHVGQLTAPRGQADLIRAAGAAASDPRCPFPVVVRIIGGGAEAYVAELYRLAAGLATERFRVELLGGLPPDRVREFYAGGHLFVHTSHLPEGLPRVMMEAMLAGLPIIATHTGGQRDILADGRWGPLLPPGDVERLAADILDAMEDYSAWRERADRAREAAQSRFDLEVYIDRHLHDLAETAEKMGSEAFSRVGPPGDSRKAILAPFSQEELAVFGRALGDAAERAVASLDVAARPDEAWESAVVLKRTGRLTAAERVLRDLRAMHADEPVHLRRATFHLAEIAMLAERWPEAADLLAACLAVAPDHRKAIHDLDHARRRVLPDHLGGLREEMKPPMDADARG